MTVLNKRILFVGNSELSILKMRKELIVDLISKGFDVYVTFPKSVYGNGVDTSRALGCKYIESSCDCHGKNPFRELKEIRQYEKIIYEVHPLCVLTFTIKPNIYGTLAASRHHVPSIVNITGLGTSLTAGGLGGKLIKDLLKFSLNKSFHIFCQNQSDENFCIHHKIGNKKTSLLPGSGVNLRSFSPLPYPEEKEYIHFFYIARVMKEKGIEQYLDAAEAVHGVYPKVVFHILGDYEDRSFEERIKELESKKIVVFHGYQKSILEYQKLNSCTIHPSYYPEGMSNALLESAACAKPIITTDQTGCKEIVDDGLTGYVIPKKDSSALVSAIFKFLSLSRDERAKMGLLGRKKIEKEFDRNIIVSEYLKQIQLAQTISE